MWSCGLALLSSSLASTSSSFLLMLFLFACWPSLHTLFHCCSSFHCPYLLCIFWCILDDLSSASALVHSFICSGLNKRTHSNFCLLFAWRGRLQMVILAAVHPLSIKLHLWSLTQILLLSVPWVLICSLWNWGFTKVDLYPDRLSLGCPDPGKMSWYPFLYQYTEIIKIIMEALLLK